MAFSVFLFTQSGYLSCGTDEAILARKVSPEERIQYFRLRFVALSYLKPTIRTAPTVVILTPAGVEVIEGFEPDRLDRVLDAA